MSICTLCYGPQIKQWEKEVTDFYLEAASNINDASKIKGLQTKADEIYNNPYRVKSSYYSQNKLIAVYNRLNNPNNDPSMESLAFDIATLYAGIHAQSTRFSRPDEIRGRYNTLNALLKTATPSNCADYAAAIDTMHLVHRHQSTPNDVNAPPAKVNGNTAGKSPSILRTMGILTLLGALIFSGNLIKKIR